LLELAVTPGALVAFVLAMVRTVAWLTVAPPFNAAVMQPRIRVALAVGLAFLMSVHVPTEEVGLGVGDLLLATGYQVFVGFSLGFIVRLYFAAFEAAGAVIDFTSGLSIGAVYDPLTGNQNAPIARFYGLIAAVLLFASGGHLIILSGYLRSFEAAPLGGPSLDQLGFRLLEGLGIFFVAALEIALPIAGVLVVTEIGLALLARAAPQANVLMIGLTVKALVLVLMLTTAISVLPWATENLADQATRAAFGLW
jgi:flagellar biosynthetic protein FliR